MRQFRDAVLHIRDSCFESTEALSAMSCAAAAE